ncbi:UDP-N-acetylmuramoyl-tripeptide--D-alanyl-D-alanine ligase [Noviherbaspirillum galbum]|uniref:UDP-N-acetylmuramoyl-tripeptide--D-alanyl-D-alanine ligase n=1 Tax=Noviherbaspirillum galbum TaxID=2709383 RepID=A0A6B3SVI5_9BURK|nr:UDP-N-acetylmuramoyl-tripeptide--D-alanyl-D-alanine ligase [Noviherbaspirillum galbum]NEX64511.1 UDP-N-acetylmuramoyl-tripeptide--D-alanyl-D-alanine ligase [Noviherbaspirillum galbum]
MKSSLAAIQPWISQATTANAAAGGLGDVLFDGVSTDSRNVSAGNLFVALRGERFDAHAFLNDVAARGVAAVVAEELPAGFTLPAIVVPDTRAALAQIAAGWRKQFTMPVIGVTGSNGKTTVKEMIAAILNAAFGAEQCMATRGNLNNEIGVPLTVFRMQDGMKAAVVELGMNHPGEIAVLASVAKPTVGLVNNAQREHQEFMASVEAVARENGAVIQSLDAAGTAVFPADDEFTSLWRGFAADAGCKVMTFGLDGDADVSATYAASAFGSELTVSAQGKTFKLKLSAAGVHNVRNALAATACALAAGIPADAVIRGLESFAPVNGRLQRKTGKHGALVVDDTYNANPDSVRAAIDVLASLPAPRVLVLGDMGEVGNDGPAFHEEVGAYAKSRGIERLLALGDLARHSARAYGGEAEHFGDVAALNAKVDSLAASGTTVLVKGSRFMKMERVVQHLTASADAQQGGH